MASISSKFAPDALLHSYKKSFNGFVVKLTEEEAVRMAGMHYLSLTIYLSISLINSCMCLF